MYMYICIYICIYIGKSLWGVWDDTTLKKIIVIKETSIVNAAEIVGIFIYLYVYLFTC
jgi:hypothetical protein